MNNGPGKHSFVHNIQIASPCKADWSKMTGDERKRFCGDCKLHVYNIASMTLMEAEQLIIDSEGKVCLRLYRRTDGTVITKDCPVGLKDRLKRRWLVASGAASAAVALLFAWVTKSAPPLAVSTDCPVQGDVSVSAPVAGNISMPDKAYPLMGAPPPFLTETETGKPAQNNAVMGEMTPSVPMTGIVAPMTGKVKPSVRSSNSGVMGRVKSKDIIY